MGVIYDFTVREYEGKQQSGTYPGHFDDAYDFEIGSVNVAEGCPCEFYRDGYWLIDLSLPSLTVDSGASISMGHNVQFRGDGTGAINLQRGSYFLKGGFSKSNDKAPITFPHDGQSC